MWNGDYLAERMEYYGDHEIWSIAGGAFCRKVDDKYNIEADYSSKFQAGGIGNSFHHILGQTAVTICFGEGFAKYAGDAHERSNDNLNFSNYDDTVCDLINNEYARELGKRWLETIGGDATKATNAQVADLLNTIAVRVMQVSPGFNDDASIGCEVPQFTADDDIVKEVTTTIHNLAD